MSKHFYILSIIVILIIIGYYISKGQSSKNTFEYKPDNIDIVVVDSDESMSQNQSSENSQSDGVDKQLGPATVEEIIGGTSSEEFYQTPSIEKLLEEREIEVGK